MSVKTLKNEIDFTRGLLSVAQSYNQLAGLRIQKIREKIEHAREFFDEISSLYRTIKQVAGDEYNLYPEKNKRTAAVLLTSNNRFYGNVNNQIVSLFQNYKKEKDMDVFVVGRVGAQDPSLRGAQQTFVFKGELPEEAELAQLSQKLQPYQKVLVFYAQAKSLLSCTVQVEDITQKIEKPALPPRQPAVFDILIKGEVYKTQKFIFEPEIIKTIEFFERVATSLLLAHAFLEVELARSANRLFSMDQAQYRAGQLIQKDLGVLRGLEKAQQNQRLLEVVLSYN